MYMKKYILSSIILLLAAANTAWGQNVATVNGTGYTTLADALNAAREAAAGGWNTTSVTVEILEDITFSPPTDTWTPILYDRLNPITINGNNHTITNLPGMLYAKSGSGVSTLTINNLTFESPTVSLTTDYAAVIMGYADCVQGLYFNNVTINKATVTGANYVAAFVGYAAGYNNANDGPVYQHVVFNNCQVTKSTLTSTGGGSVGALMGHASGNVYGQIEVEGTTVSGNTITTSGTNKAGALFGTVGAAGATNDHPEAGLYVSANVSGNDVKANGTAITTIYGRQGTSTGRLTLTEGGSYDAAPIAAADMTAGWAGLEKGTELTQNSNGTYSVELPDVAKIGTTGYKTLAAAIAAAQDGATIEVIANVTELENGSELTIDKSLTITGAVDGSGNPLYTISGKSDATGTNYISITGSGTVTLSNLKIKNFGNNTGTDGSHAPVYVSDSFTGTVNLVKLYISNFNRGGIFLYGGAFNVDDCYIDCANSRSGAFTKGIEIKGTATGTIADTYICNMERSSTTYSTAGIEIYGNGSVTVDGCTIVSDDGEHHSVKATYGIVSSRVGVHDPSGGTLHVTNTMTNTTNGSISVSDDAEYGPVNNYTIILDECDFDNYISTWSATSSITINSGEYAKDVYADAGTITIHGGNFTNFVPDTGTNGSIVIDGGTFDHAVPVDYCALYYEPTEQDPYTDLYGVQHIKVAEVYASNGDLIDQYTSFVDAWAVANANAGSTLKMLVPDDVTSQLEASGTFTLDFNGNQLQYIGTSELASGVILVLRGAHLTLEDTNFDPADPETVGGIVSDVISYNIDPNEPNPIITVDDIHDWYGDVKYAYAAIALTKNGETSTDNAVLTVNGGELYGHYYGIVGNGNRHGTEITVNGGTITGAEGSAIYHPQNGTLTITNGTFTGKETGIELRSGTLVVEGGTFETQSTEYSCNPNGSGTTTVGAAIAIAQHTTNQPIDATISGGTFTIPSTGNAVKLSVSNPQNNSFSNVSVSGLTALIGESNKIPDGYMWVEANGISTLSKAVAKIGNVKYATLAAAFAAVEDGQTITMLANSVEAAEPVLAISGSVTLDLNGKTVTANDDIWVKTGSLTVVGSSGSTITSTGSAIYVSTQSIANNVATLTINSSDVTVHGDGYGVVVMSGGVVNQLAGTITSTNHAAISTNGTNTGSTINITSGTVTSTGSTAIYHPGPGTLTIGDSNCLGENNSHSHPVITGKTGVEMRAGTLNVYCGEITGNGEFAETANNSGSTITGAAVAISQHTTNLAINANIAGGTLSGTYGVYEKDLQDPTTGANVNIAVTGGDISGTTSAVAINDITAESVNASISGGTFSSPVPMEYLADGFICPSTTNNDGRYYIEQGEYVAQIDNYGYETLEAAFAAVEDGETITMLTDVTLTAPMNLELGTKAVTLDLGGKTLTGRTNLKSGNLTIQNGTVAGGEQQALNVYGSADSNAQNYSVLTIASNVTVTADQFGVCMFGATATTNGYGAVVNIAGTVHTTGTGAEGAVFVSGNLGQNIDGDMKNVINVYGTITSATDAAIALNGNATVNVKDGATITGNTAIAIKRGTLNVEGGTVHATGLGNIPTAGNNNGTEMTGAAVSMTNTYNQYGEMQVNISGGSFTSDHAMALYKQEGTYTNDATYAVSGGIFNTPVPEEFCAEGYVPTSITTQGFTQYTVESGVFVAQIGETKYTTLAAAVAAVPTNGTETTITLLKDITLTNNVVVGGTFDGTNNSNAKKVTSVTNQNVILNLDGHTITGTKTLYLAGGSLNITGTGSIISTSQDVAPVGVRYVKTADYPDLDYTSKRTLTIGENVTLTGAEYGLNIFGTNEASTANNIDVTVDGTVNGMLFVLGNLKNADNEININVNGTVDASGVTGSNEAVHTGIALGGNATVNVNNGATVKGESGIEVRAGNLTVNGGTIKATAASYSFAGNGNGMTTKGAAIAVAQHGTLVATSATILGGATLNGTKKIAVIDAQNNGLAGVTVIAADGYLDNSDTETVLPNGYYWLSNGDGTSSPAPNSYVAQIGNTFYTTLAAAVAAVQDGETIKLLDDISLTDRLFVNAGATPAYAGTDNRYATTTENKSFTLDLNGHNITSSSNIALAGGSLNITNTGTADDTHGVISTSNAGLAPIEVRGTGDLTQKRTLTVGTGVTLTGAEYGLNVFGSNDAQKNLIDVNVDGTVNGILFVLGNLSNADNAINVVVNGTVDASNAETGTKPKTGIALNGNANVTVNNGASVTGETGIEVRAGNLTVNGGTITATASDYSYTANASGTTTKGAAIAVAQHTTTKPINVQLNGGTLVGKELIGVTDVNNNMENVSVIAAASFVENTDTKLPDGFIWVNNGNGTYYIGVAPVQIIHVDNSIDSYATLAEAFNSVAAIETIKLIADVALTEDVTLDKSFNLDFNNHAINLNGHTIKLVQGETIKTNKQTNIFTAADNNYIITVEDSNDPDFPYAYSEKININTANFTVTVTPVTYDGLNHKIGGQNPVTVKIYDVSGEHELNSNNFEISMLPYTSYDAADFNNREEDVYKDAYTYINAITIKGKPEAGYAGSITVDFVIYPRDINDVTVEGQCQPYTETGYTADDNATTGIKKLVTLKYNNIPLVVSTDYTIDVDATNTYKDTGTYPEAITLTAVEGGNFTGTRKVDFVIGGDKDIATSNITATVVYTGSRQEPTGAGTTPTVIVKDGLTNAVLAQGTDYELEFIEYDESNNYIDYINAKTYTNAVTIRGIGDYYNTKTVDYIITPKNIADCNIIASTTFTGSVINPADAVQVSDPGLPADPPGLQLLAKGTDYTLTVSQGYTYLNPQTYANAITVTGTGNYTGTVTMDFTITNDNGAIDITNSLVVSTSSAIYTSTSLPPSKLRMTVKCGNTELVHGTDYTYTIHGKSSDFVDAKTYSNAVTITGIGNYYGSFTADYTIYPRDLSNKYVHCEADQPIEWKSSNIKLNVNNIYQDENPTLANNVNLYLAVNDITYNLEYADYTWQADRDLKDPGEYTITFIGRGNFTGQTQVKVQVLKDISLLADDDIEIPVQILGSVTPNIRPSNIQDMVVTDGGNVLTRGTHYTLTFTDGTTTYQGGAGPYITQEGKYTAIITGKDPYYSGEKRKDFVVVNEYYTYNAPETGKEFAVHITSGKDLTATVGAKTGAAINTESTSLTLPSTITVTVPDAANNTEATETFTLNGIENGAFAGCDNLRYIDATALEGFTPSSLQRNIAASPFNGVPKQALVFLNGTNITGENYVYNPGNGNDYYCEVFKIYDDLSGAQTGFGGNDYKWAFENPHPFTAYSVENTRQLTAERHYTICLPYALEIPNNVKAYTLEATSDKLFGFTEVTGTLAAYTPYVLIPTKSGQLLGTNNNTVIPAFPATADTDATKLNEKVGGDFTLYGNMRYMEGDDAVGKYIMQYNNGNPTWKKITDSAAGFTSANQACILPMRAYIMSNTGGSREFFDVVFTNIDGTTLTFDKVTFDDDTIYDLSGRKVELLERGHTYIINGKKVIAK